MHKIPQFMKPLFALICLSLGMSSLIGQSFTSERLRILSWKRHSLLSFTADSGSEEAKITPLNRRQKGTNTWIREAELNGDRFTLKKEAGALNVVDETGKTVLVTKRGRRLAYVGGKEYTRKVRRGFVNFSVSYLDQAGEVMVKGMLVGRELKIKLYYPEDEAGKYLLLATLDDLVRLCREQVLWVYHPLEEGGTPGNLAD